METNLRFFLTIDTCTLSEDEREYLKIKLIIKFPEFRNYSFCNHFLGMLRFRVFSTGRYMYLKEAIQNLYPEFADRIRFDFQTDGVWHVIPDLDELSRPVIRKGG